MSLPMANTNKKIKTSIKFPQIIEYFNKFEKAQYISLVINIKELSEKYKSIWCRISNIVEKEFGKQPVYQRKYANIKRKSCHGKINTYYYGKKIPKENSPNYCVVAIELDSVCSGKSED